MPAAGRVGDKAQVQGAGDAHGCPACPHPAIGPAIIGSPNVNVNMMPALRVGDVGIHAVCCGPNMWTARVGSTTVFINGIAAHRKADMGQSCGGMTKLIEGSPNVNIGDLTSGGGGGGSGSSGSGESGTGAGTSGGRSGTGSSQTSGGAATGSLGKTGDPDARADSRWREGGASASTPAKATPPEKAWIEIVIEDEDGAPMEGMPYKLELPDYTMTEGKLDARGRVRRDQIEPGLARLWVPDVDHDHDPVPPVRPENDEEKSWIDVEILGPDGRPAAGRPVKIELPDGTVFDDKLDENGRLYRADLPAGHAKLHVPDEDVLAWRPAKKPAIAEEPKAFIEVQLTDDLGRPRGDTPVKLELPDGTMVDAKTDAQGVLRKDGIAPGTARLHVPDDDTATAARAAAASVPEEELKAFIEVQLTDDLGRPRADTPVKLELPDGTMVDAKTDAQGVLRKDGIKPGTARLHVPDTDAGGGGAAAAPVADAAVEEKAFFELSLTDDRGRPLANTSVKLELADGTMLDEKTDDQGVLRKDGLKPGPVKLHLPEDK